MNDFASAPALGFRNFYDNSFESLATLLCENGKAIFKKSNCDNLINQDVMAFTSLSHLKKQFLQILRLIERSLCLEQPLRNSSGIFF